MKRFRVNTNGNRLDVWLIYQCENCKHTYNFTIYEREKVSSLPEKEYQRLLSKENRAKIDLKAVNYHITRLRGIPDSKKYQHPVEIMIRNLCGLKIRSEKQIAEVLSLSRS